MAAPIPPDAPVTSRHAITLTPAGRTAIEDLRRAGEGVERQLLDCLTEAERVDLHRVLRKLLAALNR